MFFAGVCNVHDGHLHPRGGAPPFSPFVDVYSVNAETSHVDFAFSDPFVHDGKAEAFRARRPWLGADVSEGEDLGGEAWMKQRLEFASL